MPLHVSSLSCSTELFQTSLQEDHHSSLAFLCAGDEGRKRIAALMDTHLTSGLGSRCACTHFRHGLFFNIEGGVRQDGCMVQSGIPLQARRRLGDKRINQSILQGRGAMFPLCFSIDRVESHRIRFLPSCPRLLLARTCSSVSHCSLHSCRSFQSIRTQQTRRIKRQSLRLAVSNTTQERTEHH